MAARQRDDARKQLFKRPRRAPWLPAETLARPKTGFGVPLRRWFAEGLIGWARDILLDPAHRTSAAGRDASRGRASAARSTKSAARDHAKRIWALVCLELWARQHVDRAGGRERACA